MKPKDEENVRNRRGFARRSGIISNQLSIINSSGFTLIELLVVVAVIAVLLAIFIPVANRARELGQRAVCLSNLRQLTMAWTAYADQHDAKLVNGVPFGTSRDPRGRPLPQSWVGQAFWFPKDRSAVLENTDKGALWPYLRNTDAYRCPGGWTGHALTYDVVSGANGFAMPGTYVPDTDRSKQVGKTVLRLTRLTDIMSPGASQRAVFLDRGYTTLGDFAVSYLDPAWVPADPPPLHHANGMTISMADGHAEYWKWKGRETIDMPRKLATINGLSIEILDVAHCEPKTEEGLYDLQRLQKATWGRLPSPDEMP
jgi:prepilin-type N-terminal cleavage/methylation domain-containing protein/prepilin-type processing-associated H-X9-DG protein